MYLNVRSGLSLTVDDGYIILQILKSWNLVRTWQMQCLFVLQPLWNDPSKWQVFENTHKAIINQETFDIVQ